MDWLGKLINLPVEFLHSNQQTKGGGVIQRVKAINPDLEDADINGRLVGYCSEQLCATLGTTGACAFDNLEELGPICKKEDIWMHIDAAYAGTAFLCPEFRHFMKGHWQIPLSKRFRALKLWFVLRSFGRKGLQEHVRKGDDDLTELLLKRINRSGQLHMVPASIKGKYIIRYTVTSQYTTVSDIERDWALIGTMASGVLTDENPESATTIAAPPRPISAAGQMKREGLVKKEFGISLILSNVPMSPKFINGSFAALFETNDVIVEFARNLGRNSIDLNGRPIRLSPRKRPKEPCQKQYSFDLCLLPPHARRGVYHSKQASLDSKIEEIFDTSLDSDPGDGDVDVGGLPVDSDRKSPDDGKTDDASSLDGGTDDDVTENGRKSRVVNGVQSVFCQKCGSLLEYET
ncbi:hypothetical protein LSH36_209g03023 [Paralvinella palmiformis]|uniref:Histidine decarboxylase n=1 Tax=Paralvinella palmiformis TaxID=53620 RepID=A0AAD9JPL2_9ANNE|nr:hypothetical protein LSH36_209g03023 [Paralvinella palmiformis]